MEFGRLARVIAFALAIPSVALADDWGRLGGEPQVARESEVNGVPMVLEAFNNGREVNLRFRVKAVPPEFAETNLSRGDAYTENFLIRVPLEEFSAGIEPRKVEFEYYVPGCERSAEGKATVTISGGVLAIDAPELRIRPAFCRDINKTTYSATIAIPFGTDADMQALHIIGQADRNRCNVRRLAEYEEGELPGLEAMVYGSSSQISLLGVLHEGIDRFASMAILGYQQTGPKHWDYNLEGDWLFHGEKVEVLGAESWAAPGDWMSDRIVRVRKLSDGRESLFNGKFLITGDPAECDTRLLVTEKRLGVWVKVRPGAQIYDRRWIEDEGVKYGFCVNATLEEIECQTRAYPEPMKSYASGFNAALDDVEVLYGKPEVW